MDSNTTLNCIVQSSAIDLKTIILALSLFFSTLLSVFFYVKNRSYGFENSINERLFKIQDIAFNNPFLESLLMVGMNLQKIIEIMLVLILKIMM